MKQNTLRSAVRIVAFVLASAAAPSFGQKPSPTPVPNTTTVILPKASSISPATTRIPTPDTTVMQSLLPPAPDVTDWRPRNRAVVGGKIVITGRDLRPQDFIAVLGSQRFRLPVRQGSSGATHIELDVPDGALGVHGKLVVGLPGTQSRTLDETYRVDAPAPAIDSLAFNTGSYPFVSRTMTVRVKEFPGARVNAGDVTFTGACRFVRKPGISYGNRDRADDLSIEFSLQGWFERPGPCALELRVVPIAADGTRLAPIRLDSSWNVPSPVTYSFSSSADLKSRFQPSLAHFGVGSVCTGGDRGVDDHNGDFSTVIRGGPLDVSCTFRTKEWILPEGVRLKEIRWGTSKQGIRCGNAGTFSATFPGFDLPTLSRGAVVVRPNADQPESDFVAFGAQELVVDGVTYSSNLAGPRTMIKPMVLPMQCVSMAMPLTTNTGTHPPTLDPQSFRIILEKLVLEGPPNLSLP